MSFGAAQHPRHHTPGAQGTAARAAIKSALPPLWFVIASALAFAALLLSFQHVVRQGVQTADMRRQVAAAQSAALWRCQALQERQERDGCIAGVPGSAGIATAIASAYASF